MITYVSFSNSNLSFNFIDPLVYGPLISRCLEWKTFENRNHSNLLNNELNWHKSCLICNRIYLNFVIKLLDTLGRWFI